MTSLTKSAKALGARLTPTLLGSLPGGSSYTLPLPSSILMGSSVTLSSSGMLSLMLSYPSSSVPSLVMNTVSMDATMLAASSLSM